MELVGLNFNPRLELQRNVWRSLKLPISRFGSVFFLVVSFGRCRFRLSLISVGLILQAIVGGSAEDLQVL